MGACAAELRAQRLRQRSAPAVLLDGYVKGAHEVRAERRTWRSGDGVLGLSSAQGCVVNKEPEYYLNTVIGNTSVHLPGQRNSRCTAVLLCRIRADRRRGGAS